MRPLDRSESETETLPPLGNRFRIRVRAALAGEAKLRAQTRAATPPSPRRSSKGPSSSCRFWARGSPRNFHAVVPRLSRDSPAGAPNCPAVAPRLSRGCPAVVPSLSRWLPRAGTTCFYVSRPPRGQVSNMVVPSWNHVFLRGFLTRAAGQIPPSWTEPTCFYITCPGRPVVHLTWPSRAGTACF